MAKVGLVTVLYKSDDVLEGFFQSLSVQTFKDYHLYLIDNSPGAETDAVVNQLLNKYPICHITHIKNPGNYGVAKGNNQGIELALKDNSAYVVLLNNDIDFPQDFLLADMVKCAEEKNEAVIIPKIFYHGTRTIWMAGGTMLKYKGYTGHVGDNQQDTEAFNKEGYFDYAPTCFMLLNSKVFDKVGLMDEKYFVYYDDTDFVVRLIKAGYKIFYMPTLEVFHKVSSSTGGGESLFSIYYLNRNRVYFIRKNYSFPVKQVALAYTVLTRGLRYLHYKQDQKKEMFRGFKDGFSIT
ncbi:glycosyltransferase family 2 protein [Mucilaginibacter sp.]|uniref:glycosyltransferase family 2 protein n=1 Tax=Mucilaginibacter sp. TaxID=1882438 RepID=UPI0032644401